MVAPVARHRQVQLVAAGALERPAIVLHRALQHVEGMGREAEFVLVGDGHAGTLDSAKHKTKQLRPKLAQDFVVAQESANSSSASAEKIPQL